MKNLLLTCFFGLFVPATLFATTDGCAFDARIVDADGEAVAGAVLHLLERDERFVADDRGEICAPALAPGRHSLLVVAEGFSVLDAAVTRTADAPLRVVLELTPAFGEEMVVTGTRTAKRLVESPVPVRVVDRDAIEASGARTLAEAVELAPGVRVESGCQNCNFSELRLLGLEGPYSQILVESQPTVSSLALVYGLEQFPARLLESVEVVKGGGAAIYGAGAVGGVINLIPHAPLDVHTTLEARRLATDGEGGYSLTALVDRGSRERRAGVSVLGQVDSLDPVDLDGDGFTEVASRELSSFSARGEHYFAEDRAKLHAELSWTEASRRGGDLERFDRPPEETALTEAIDTRRLGATLGLLHTVSPRFDYRLVGSFADTSRDSYYGGGFDPNAYGTTENPLWIVDAQANRHHQRGTYTFGAQYRRDEIEDRQPGYGRWLLESDTNLGVYLQDDRAIGDRLTLVYGARLDDPSSLDSAVVSPRLALMAAPRDDLAIRLSYAEGFRAPVTFDEDLHIELAGGAARITRRAPDLVEERSTASLASLEWRPTFGRKGSASLEIAAFRTDLDALFDVIEADDPSTPVREFLRVNAEGARVEGVEATASIRWGVGLLVQVGWVFQSARYDIPEPDFGSREFFRTPGEHGSLTVQARLPASLDLFLGARYTGSMQMPHYAGFLDEDRLETTPAFLEIDVSLARTFSLAGRDLAITLGARNLTDEYQEDLDQGPDRDSNYVYGPRLPRSFHAGLRWEF